MGFLSWVLYRTQSVLESVDHMHYARCIQRIERFLALALAILFYGVIKHQVISWSFKLIWSMTVALWRELLCGLIFIILRCVSIYSTIEKLNKLEFVWPLRGNKFCLHYETISWPVRVFTEIVDSSLVVQNENMSTQTRVLCVATINVNHMTDLKATLIYKHTLAHNIDVLCVTESRYAINTDVHTICGYDVWIKTV